LETFGIFLENLSLRRGVLVTTEVIKGVTTGYYSVVYEPMGREKIKFI